MQPEDPAKNWQITSLEKRLDFQERVAQRIEEKLDKILLNQTSPQQLEERLVGLNKLWEDKLATLANEVDLKYSPTTKALRQLQTTIAGAILAQVVYILFNTIR